MGVDGEHVLRFAIATGTAVVNTVEDYLTDPDDTGTYHPNEHALAIACDYILTDDTSNVGAKSVHTWHDMALHADHLDHIPLVATVKCRSAARHRVSRGKGCQI